MKCPNYKTAIDSKGNTSKYCSRFGELPKIIARVALEIGDNILIGKKNARHDSLYTDEVVKWILKQKDRQTQGFITSEGEFVDRYKAAKIAFMSGQISKQIDCLVSEDLW